MTVEEFIYELKRYPEDYEVLIKDNWLVDNISADSYTTVYLESKELEDELDRYYEDLESYRVEYR